MLVFPVTLGPLFFMVLFYYTPYLKVHGVAINALNSTGIFSSSLWFVKKTPYIQASFVFSPGGANINCFFFYKRPPNDFVFIFFRVAL